MKYRTWIICVFIVLLCTQSALSQEPKGTASETPAPELQEVVQPSKTETAIKMLASVLNLKAELKKRIAEKNRLLQKSSSAAEKDVLSAEIDKLDKQLRDTTVDFERIATGIDTSLFSEKKAKAFDWKGELVSLVEPGIKEIKRMTVRARSKTALKDELSRYEDMIPIARQAVENLHELMEQASDSKLKSQVKGLLPEWEGLEKQLRNKHDITRMRLTEMDKEEKSFIETSRTSIKNFFKTRGLFLVVAVVACIGMMLLFRLSTRTLIRFVPGYRSKYRPFHIRMLTLLGRVLSVTIVLFVLIFVFYSFEDWVLLSLTIVFIMGLGWTARQALPKYWHQSRLMLNIGSVREGERMIYKGVPWQVKDINVFTEIENTALDIKLRLPIEELMGRTSRPFHPKEPWFPCKRGDWVILSDGTRGVVTSQSHEMVELVQRGGARKTYLTPDFLSLAPLNLSVNFRLKVPFGISYDLQKASTKEIPETLAGYIERRIEEEGYQKSLLNLRVEFQQAAASSLDLLVIADFKGEQAPLYQRLTRAIQRWCTEACTLHDWEIPFTQITLHQALQKD